MELNRLFSAKALVTLIIPLVIEQLLAVTIGMADTVMVASIGEIAVSSVSLVDAINTLLIQVFSALATGGAVVAAQYLGRGDQLNARKAAKQLIYIITLLASVIMFVSVAANKLILHGIFGSIDPEVMSGAEVYFFLSALSYPFLAVYNAGAALFRSMGNSKVSMYTSLVMNVINICGNAILIYGFGWGVAGAAAASLLSRAFSAFIIIALLRNKKNSICIEHILKIQVNFDMIRRILKIGVPNGAENGMFQIGKLLVQGLVASFGTASIAANAIANSIAGVANIPGTAIGLGILTVVGQCVGANDYDQAVFYSKKLIRTSYITNALLNLFLLISTAPLVRLFNLSGPAQTEAIVILRWFVVFCALIWPASFTTPSALRAAGDAKFTMIVSMISMWIFRIGFSYILGIWFNMGVLGIWIAMFIDWIVRAIVFTVRFRNGKWQRIKII